MNILSKNEIYSIMISCEKFRKIFLRNRLRYLKIEITIFWFVFVRPAASPPPVRQAALKTAEIFLFR